MARLLPLQVPWMISTSNPSLGLTTKEHEGTNLVVISFEGYVGPSTNNSQAGRYYDFAVRLDGTVHIKLYPEFSHDDKDRIDSYDWHLVTAHYDEANAFRNYAERFNEAWERTGLCPNPSAYIVEDSDVLRRLNFTPPEWNHYLFIGHDFNIEIIARSMRWRVIEPTGEDQILSEDAWISP